MQATFNVVALWAAFAVLFTLIARFYREEVINNYRSYELYSNAVVMWVSIALALSGVQGMVVNLILVSALCSMAALATLAANFKLYGITPTTSDVVRSIFAPVLVTLLMAKVPKSYEDAMARMT